MTFLSADEIASMRADIAATLPGTCVIQGVVEVSDGAGGVTPTWTPVTGGTVACRVDHLDRRGQVETVAEAEGFIAEFHLIVPYTAPVAANRRVIHNGYTYEIRSLSDDGDWLLLKKCRIVRVE